MFSPLVSKNNQENDQNQCFLPEQGNLLIYSQMNAVVNSEQQKQFYIIKSYRLEKQLKIANQQNNRLHNKIKQLIDVVENQKDRIWQLQNESSQHVRNLPSFFTGTNSASSSLRASMDIDKLNSLHVSKVSKQINSQATQMMKQIRDLKNFHELQKTHWLRQNSKLQKQLAKHEKTSTSIKNKDKNNQDSQQIDQLKKQNQYLHGQLKKFLDTDKRIKNENKKLREDKIKLSEEIQQLQVIESSHKRHDKFDGLKEKYNELSKLIQSRKKIGTQISQYSIISEVSINQSITEIQKPLDFVASHQESRNKLLQLKITQLQNQIVSKNQEIKNILTKLKPLITSMPKPQPIKQCSDRASLAILDVFLKKYKINLF